MTGWAAGLREAMEDALALVLPVACAGCGAPDRAVCPACRAALAGPVVARRLTSARLDVVSGTSYEGAAARIVTALKDGGLTEAAGALAVPLRRAVDAASALVPDTHLLLVPAPSAARSTRRRGYVPIELVARAARLPVTRSLRSIRTVRDQASLGAAERLENVAGSMVAHPRVTGRTVLLIDDVVTTGSTLAEAARAVRQAGGSVLAAATITATPAHSSAASGGPAQRSAPPRPPPLPQELNR
ncbi:ComF family protein [Naasia aerilata]|uniref:Phosphoribosyltransferase domain-containing protein n=1 Tax=Naasia aerilata TaxID=1162966 RepID=A0ABM8GCQ2_9MICO|nr:phosphoribosyltransferase family protein [Naasia aerilata]BDZ46002.1 hypothetical protein GCM10025866_19110 [Naasia aerilata]